MEALEDEFLFGSADVGVDLGDGQETVAQEGLDVLMSMPSSRRRVEKVWRNV